MKNNAIFLFVVASAFFIVAATPERSSSGAPGGHTGAPDEQTCAASGCHDDRPTNNGTANLSIEVANGISNYIPGKTYEVKIKIADEGVNRFGFQLIALTNETRSTAGTFEIIDFARTQLVKDPKNFPDRTYVTYSFKGTDATEKGMSEWTVKWTAPKENVGSVVFYAAGVSANDDMTDKNDNVYTVSKVMNNQ